MKSQCECDLIYAINNFTFNYVQSKSLKIAPYE